jgi:hypothetical protein
MINVEPFDEWRFKLVAPFYFKNYFKYKGDDIEWNVYLKRYTKIKVDCYLYDEQVKDGFIFHIGFAAFVLYHYGDDMDQASKDYCRKLINPLSHLFTDLRAEQNKDVNDMLKYNRGIFQVYTGYGKTEIIANLVNYIVNERKERLLVLTPNSSSLNELDNRVKKLYNMTHEYFDYNSDYNAININGFPRSSEFNKKDPYWKSVKWILADESEYIVNDTGCNVIELCKNVDRMYAFSATADKKKGERIRLRDGNIPVVQRNKTLIGYFGFTTVFKKPEDFTIYQYNINTTMFNNIKDTSDKSTDYNEIVYDIFTDDRFCKGLAKIAVSVHPVYIPMGRLQIIDNWISKYFNLPNLKVVNICGRGYELYNEGKLVEVIDLDKLKELIDTDSVDIITGTKSSYRALDLPKLNKVIPLTSQLASNVLQAIGRVARTRSFTIYNLIPFNKVNVYSVDLMNRLKLINNYYSDCNIIKISKKETDYGIYY